jgi:hypothetical protein
MTATRASFCSILLFNSENKVAGIDSIVIVGSVSQSRF